MSAPSPTESLVPISGVQSSPPQGLQPSPNLRLVLHWITELLILAACWWGWRTGQVPAWAFGLVAGVIGGWLPTSLVLQAVHAVIVARAGGAPASLPAPAPVLPPPATVALLAFCAPAVRLAAMRLGVLVLAVVLLLGCGPRVREVALDTIPGVPPREDAGCVERSTRCSPGSVSRTEVCSGGRWWSSMPPRPDGTPRVCEVRCVEGEDGGLAHCEGVLP